VRIVIRAHRHEPMDAAARRLLVRRMPKVNALTNRAASDYDIFELGDFVLQHGMTLNRV
jgi:hypothetical protein